MSHARTILGNICTGAFDPQSIQVPIALMLVVATFSHILRSKGEMEEWFIRLPAPVQGFGYAFATIIIYLFFTTEQRFIYFQF